MTSTYVTLLYRRFCSGQFLPLMPPVRRKRTNMGPDIRKIFCAHGACRRRRNCWACGGWLAFICSEQIASVGGLLGAIPNEYRAESEGKKVLGCGRMGGVLWLNTEYECASARYAPGTSRNFARPQLYIPYAGLRRTAVRCVLNSHAFHFVNKKLYNKLDSTYMLSKSFSA